MSALTPDLTRRILAAVNDGFADQLQLTRDLIAIPSLRGEEHIAQDRVCSELARRGLEIDRFAIDEAEIRDHPGFSPVTVDYTNAINVVATHKPRAETGRSLILNGHIDVVPTGPTDMWTRAPFEPWLDGDWLYGRGGGDMKAGLVANIAALDALKSLGYQPAATVHVQSVTEEECTGNGALACLVRGYDAEAAIIPEPEDDRLVRANTGVLWFKVHVRGRPVHVRDGASGANAIEAMWDVIKALRALEAEWNRRKVDHAHFRHLDHPINLNIGKIAGGDWASSVPAWCTIDCRIAIYPGIAASDAADEVTACIDRAARASQTLANNPPEVEWNGFFAEGYVLGEGSEAEAVLARAHLASHGSDLESFTTPGYLDGRVFVLYGRRPCLVYGPLAHNIHAFDERVSLTSIRRVTGAIALFIAEWCGLEKVATL